MKTNTTSVIYASPSVRVIAINTSSAILTVSKDIYNTDPTEMVEEDVF